jgi:hypothetical protein
LGISKNQAQNLINKGRSRKDGGSQILESVMKPKGYLAGGSIASSVKKDSKKIKKTNKKPEDPMGDLFGKDKKFKVRPKPQAPYHPKFNPDQYHPKLNPDGKKGRPMMKKKLGGSSNFGMLSVKAGIDKNPKPTQADRIAGAKIKKEKPIKARDGASVNKEFPEPEATTAEFRIEMVPEEYRESFRKKFMGNRGETSQKTKKKEKTVQRAKGGGLAIQGLGFRGVR